MERKKLWFLTFPPKTQSSSHHQVIVDVKYRKKSAHGIKHYQHLLLLVCVWCFGVDTSDVTSNFISCHFINNLFLYYLNHIIIVIKSWLAHESSRRFVVGSSAVKTHMYAEHACDTIITEY